MVMVPSVIGRYPVSIRIVVDLPAPFGPRNPRTSPLFTSKDIPFTATAGPNFLVTDWALIMMFESWWIDVKEN